MGGAFTVGFFQRRWLLASAGWLMLALSLVPATRAGESSALIRVPRPAPSVAGAPSALILLEAYPTGLFVYPAGRYPALFADARGVYYGCPYRVLHIDLGNVAAFDGGFYVSRSQPALVRNYVETPGSRTKRLGGAVEGLRSRWER